MVALGYLERGADADDRRRTRLALSARGERIRARAREESRRRWRPSCASGSAAPHVGALRRLLVDFVERHGGAEELAAQRSRVPEQA